MIQKTVLASGGWYHVRSVVVAAAISQPSSAAGPLPRGRETDEMRHENASVRALHILWPHLAAAPTSDLVLCDTSSRRPSAGLFHRAKGLPELGRQKSHRATWDRAKLFHLSTFCQSLHWEPLTVFCMHEPRRRGRQRFPFCIASDGYRRGMDEVLLRSASRDRTTMSKHTVTNYRFDKKRTMA